MRTCPSPAGHPNCPYERPAWRRVVAALVWLGLAAGCALGGPIDTPGGRLSAAGPAARAELVAQAAAGAATASAASLTCLDVFELTVRSDSRPTNPFHDAALEAAFTSPAGARQVSAGFYYGADSWRVRFRPDAPGRWSYSYVLSGPAGLRQQGEGTFDCSPGPGPAAPGGPLRPQADNPYRWIDAAGRPFTPLGLQDCMGVEGDRVQAIGIDGEGRADQPRLVSAEEYLAIYAGAGLNLFRFSPDNCSYPLFDDLDHYLEAEGRATDALLAAAHRNGLRVMFGFFGSYSSRPGQVRLPRPVAALARRLGWSPGEGHPGIDDPALLAREKRYIDYCIARWGVYVDFWQLLNEVDLGDAWTAEMAAHVRAVDPLRRPVSTSWEKPYLAGIDVNTPHWYETEDELQSDRRVAEQAARWKAAGKPVLVGEHGNSGMNWDARSALRLRIRAWTALFQDIGLVLWNTSWSKAGMHQGRPSPGGASNIYLGPEERGYLRALRAFSSRLDADVRPLPAAVSAPGLARAYAMRSDAMAVAYVHHTTDHSTPVRGLRLTIQLPEAGTGAEGWLAEWIDPATGTTAGQGTMVTGQDALDVPEFVVDLALRISPAGAR